jgi:glyoxylase-like metal-dependent hydrolase (beta-lactamase superfamily II)/rhodanese-related sulfurtransferase
MEVQQIYTGCLAQGAYYIESNGEAAIIDPLREVQPYIDLAESRGAKIKYILETHFHADFVSGHLTLSEKTGAPIIYGPNADPAFDATIATDGQIFELGDVKIKVLHTPGHTMESTCYLLIDEHGKEHAVFSGDTLFLGDVGRPDLAQKAADMTQEQLAATLFDSLREKIMTLPDETVVYPGHGAGSACGKNMSKETVGSIGHEKETNYALRSDMTKDEFVKEVTDGLMPPPAYFPMNVQMNKAGYKSIDDVLAKGETAMAPEAFEVAANETGALVLDVRHQDQFVVGHIPQSIFIGLDGNFAPWVGALVKDVEQPILLVVDEDRLEEAITRLSRVGFDNILGYLKGGFDAWKNSGKEIDVIESISAAEFADRLASEGYPVYDVRKSGEFASEHVDGAENTPLDFLNDHLSEFPADKKYFIHCAGGYRSVIAASILKARGIHNMIDVKGGFKAIKETNVNVSDYVCPSTL